MNPRDILRQIILPLKTIDSNLPKKGKIFDLGCGEGIIAKYLAKVPSRSVIGVDTNKDRLPTDKKSNLRFITADIRKFKFQKADGIILSDVLHHLNTRDQMKLIKKVATNLKKRGVLVIKEIDSTEYPRGRLSRIWDFLLYPQDKIYYWSATDLKNFLKQNNFSVKIIRASRFFPGSTTLFVCKKL